MQTWKDAVRLTTMDDIDLSLTPETIDEVDVAASGGDRVLVTSQSDPTENGVYITGVPGVAPMTRGTAASDALALGDVIRVSEGARNRHTQWALLTPGPITVGTTPLQFSKQTLVSGWVDITQFGARPSAIGSPTFDCTQAFLDAIAAVSTPFSITFGDDKISNDGVVYVPPAGPGKEWYVAGVTSDMCPWKHVEVSRAVWILGTGSGRSGRGGSRIRFGPLCGGFRIVPQAAANDGADASGARFEGLDTYCTPIAHLAGDDAIELGWKAEWEYGVGDKIRPYRFHNVYYECVKPGKSSGPAPSIGECSQFALNDGNRWRPAKWYEVDDKIHTNTQHGKVWKCTRAGRTAGDMYGARWTSGANFPTSAFVVRPSLGNDTPKKRAFRVKEGFGGLTGVDEPDWDSHETLGDEFDDEEVRWVTIEGEAIGETVPDSFDNMPANEPDWSTDADPRVVQAFIDEGEGRPRWVPDEDDPEPIWEYDAGAPYNLALPFQKNHLYQNGAWVFATDRFDVIFVVSTGDLHAKKMSGGGEPAEFATAVPGNVFSAGDITWHAIPPVGLVFDNEVVWAARFAGAYMCQTFCEIVRPYITGAPCSAIGIFSGVAGPASFIPDFVHVTGPGWVHTNGIGIYSRGGDANAGTVDGLLLHGFELDAWKDPADHIVDDNSFLGQHYLNCKAQGCSGWAFGFRGPSATGTIAHTYLEGAGRRGPLSGNTQIQGGTLTLNNFRSNLIGPNMAKTVGGPSQFADGVSNVRAYSYSDQTPGVIVTSALKGDRDSAWYFRSQNVREALQGTNDDPLGYEMKWAYPFAGWWSLFHLGGHSPFLFSGGSSSLGHGHAWIFRGYLAGQTYRHFHFTDADQPRAAKFIFKPTAQDMRQGDIVDRPDRAGVGRYYFDVNVKSNGGRWGQQWTPNTPYLAGDIVTSSQAKETANRRAFKRTSNSLCTPSHMTTEPTWNDTIGGFAADNGVPQFWETVEGADWRLAGKIEDGKTAREPAPTSKWADSADTHAQVVVPKASARSRRRQIQTTTATANQVIEDGGLFGDEDFALPENAITILKFTGTVHKPSTEDGGDFEVKATYVRNGDAPTLIGAAAITLNLAGTTLDGTTLDLNVNGNKVELRASPETADTLNWRLFRTQFEGTD